MAKKQEKNTDLWVYDLLKDAGIKLEANASTIKEINDALSTASKKQTNKRGFPEYIGVVKDFIIVIEDKPDISLHEIRDKDGVLCDDVNATVNYAINGVIHYGKHLIKHTSYEKVIAIAISGDEKFHKITPIYIDKSPSVTILEDVETLISFNKENIDKYYIHNVLKDETEDEKNLQEILKCAETLHEDLRDYGNLQTQEKPLVVSGILLALKGIKDGLFDVKTLTGDTFKTDGEKIYNAIKDVLDFSGVSPVQKRDKILSQFAFIRDNVTINTINNQLQKTPLKHFTEYLYNNIYRSITYTTSAEDYIGRFYGEFMSYGGGDGQTLGIVLTPKHITELFCDLLQVTEQDIILDPCCGTGGFLIAGMSKEFKDIVKRKEITSYKEMMEDSDMNFIKQNHFHGFELQPYMFTIATTNMILRGDGKSNLKNDDFLAQNSSQLKKDIKATVGMINPPYSQGSSDKQGLYEICFIRHLLNSIQDNGRVAAIVPLSTMTGKNTFEKQVKEDILNHHTLEGVITLNKNTFYNVGTHPCIAIFTTGRKHPSEKQCKFINFEDDGFVVAQNVGLIETDSAKDKKQHLLDVWFDKTEAENKFCVKSSIKSTDEWLHSFYYFNDEIPTDADFEKTVGEYMTFVFKMLSEGKDFMFKRNGDENEDK